jgi:putative ABC transport system permease protein
MAITLSLAFVLGLGGHMGAIKGTMVRWMDDVLTSDFYVRASASFSRPDFRFPASLRGELLRLPGVRAVESYRRATVEIRGEPVVLATIEMGPLMDRTKRDFVEGDEPSVRRGLTREGKCAVSDNFARRFGLGQGDPVTLETPDGIARIPIAGVFRDYTSDRGTIFLDRTTFLALWKDDRVDIYDVNLLAGADPDHVREEIRKCLGSRFPALITARREFIGEISKAIDAFFALVRITLLLALVVACLGIATALVISVAERTREIGILKALGAVGPQLRRSVVLEALALAWTGLLLAVPTGNFLALFMEKVAVEIYSGWKMPHIYPWAMLGQTLLALPLVSALSAWVPARQAARVKVTEAITYE